MYTLGCYHFVEGRYPEAYTHLRSAQRLVGAVGGGKGVRGVDEGKLRGFLVACEGMLSGSDRGGGKEEVEDDSPAHTLTRLLKAEDYEVTSNPLPEVWPPDSPLCGL